MPAASFGQKPARSEKKSKEKKNLDVTSLRSYMSAGNWRERRKKNGTARKDRGEKRR